MFTVVHEGICADDAWPAVVEEIGPNSVRSASQRLEPGYLGGLLMSQPDASRPHRTRFIVIDMWDERYVGAAAVVRTIHLATAVDWDRQPRAFSAIR